jgi:peptidoglycan/LPS O-acetylase OafA/YrhL
LKTIDDQLSLAENNPSGFNYLRLVLAVGVLITHSFSYEGGDENIFLSPVRPLAFVIVPSFFALSGFLISGSLERNTISAFLTLRALRIFPALIVEVFLSALVLGPLVTTLPLSEYFTDRKFFSYFLNIIGDIHYLLPGVFSDRPFPQNTVNAQLWTVPFELECYVAITALAVFGFVKRPKWLFWASVGLILALTIRDNTVGPLHLANGKPPGKLLVASFLFGVSLYVLRRRIICNFFLFGASVFSSWILMDHTRTIYLAAAPIAYLTVYLGVANPNRISLINASDYSYGIYLYSYPIQQSIAYLFPATRIWC